MLIKILITYWILTTIYGVYWMIKNPTPSRDQEYFDLGEIVAFIFPSAVLAWLFVPMLFLTSIKFKR